MGLAVEKWVAAEIAENQVLRDVPVPSGFEGTF